MPTRKFPESGRRRNVVSVWGAIAIFPVLKLKPFLFYLLLAALGSLAVGWGYDFIGLIR